MANLIPGQYTITAEMNGFKKAVRSVFTLEVAQSATIDLTLQVGDLKQTVEVTGVTIARAGDKGKSQEIFKIQEAVE